MKVTENSTTGVTSSKSINVTENGGTSVYTRNNANSGSSYYLKTVKNGNAVYHNNTYTLDGKTYTADQISALTKGFIKLDSTAAGNFINYQLPISDKAAMLGSVLDKDLEA